jgi:isoleucyl-tRNA synthetase
MTDYRDTVFVPKTSFDMRSVKDEQAILNLWETSDLYGAMSTGADSQKRFVLHDGPPYANGDIHMGHALNKILKDITVRSRYMAGARVSFVPGWDCHGLPIESQVERDLLERGVKKSELSTVEFRKLCREYAEDQINRQMAQFKAMGVVADWQNRYATMDFGSEAKIAHEFHKLVLKGKVFQTDRPVMWSTVEGTALANAEVNHQDMKALQCWVGFPVKGDDATKVLIWTTTPWTLPANRAIAYQLSEYENKPGSTFTTYAVYEVKEVLEGSLSKVGDRLVVHTGLSMKVFEDLLVSKWGLVSNFNPEGVVCRHPLHELGYTFDVPLIDSEHVTHDTGTGFVHIAPEHGPEDFKVWNAKGMGEVPVTVLADGSYAADVPLFAGETVLTQVKNGTWIFDITNFQVLSKVASVGNLLAQDKRVVSYPHSWRSKAPLIYRATPQWFIDLDGVREKALAEIEFTEFLPEAGRNRLRAALETRPDWLVSRQRVWGTPLAIFVHKETGEPLKSSAINDRICQTFRKEGGDAWWTKPKKFWFEDSGFNPDRYDQVMDVLDVWFDSACTYRLAGLDEPADLYLEGSDQHRGWFGSALLESVAVQDEAPFNAVLTHGFVLDKNGRKMSKSEGNVVDPLVEAPKYGTDVLRLWVATSDYTQDLRVGDEILKTTQDSYRKVRNTLRYLIGALEGFTVDEAQDLTMLTGWDAYITHKVSELSEKVQLAYQEYRFNDVVSMLTEFCSSDLSAFYFDIKKDCLYCDRPDAMRRMEYRSVLHLIFKRLTHWLAPIIPFACEEAWSALHPMEMNSMRNNRGYGAEIFYPGHMDALEKVRKLQERVTQYIAALNVKPLESQVIVKVTDSSVINLLYSVDLAATFRVSEATVFLEPEANDSWWESAVTVLPAEGTKCARSRLIRADVGLDSEYPDLTVRDADAVRYWKSQRLTSL